MDGDLSMLRKLKSLFPNSLLFSSIHDAPLEHYYLFYDHVQDEWIGIPKDDLCEQEVKILKTIYELIEPLQSLHEANSPAKSWYEFLFANGKLPNNWNGLYIRFIQMKLTGNSFEKSELESALKGFFEQEILILWETSSTAIVIEIRKNKHQALSEKELEAMIEIVESDFFIKLSFYYGKQYALNSGLRELFHEEKAYFAFAQNMFNRIKFFSFERVFPAYMAFHLPEPIKEKITAPFMIIFEEDPEIFSTIRVFLENNLNASLTAKKLFIHRNTLQYRLDKFKEKTGIQFKDFYEAFTVFMACMIFEVDEQK